MSWTWAPTRLSNHHNQNQNQNQTNQVPKDKYEKLLTFVKKIYVQLGTIVEGGMQMPLDEATGMTMGFAFVNFASREEAEKAIAATNNWNFDKAHALKVPFVWVVVGLVVCVGGGGLSSGLVVVD
jgi:hypothetical protein